MGPAETHVILTLFIDSTHLAPFMVQNSTKMQQEERAVAHGTGSA